MGKELLNQASQNAAKQGNEQAEQVLRHGSISEVLKDLETNERLVDY